MAGMESMDMSASHINLDLALHEACCEGDKTKVADLIKAGADLNKIVGPQDNFDYSLITAIKTGSYPVVKLLVENGSEVQLGSLEAATFSNNRDILDFLLQPIKASLLVPHSPFTQQRWQKDLARLLERTLERGQYTAAVPLLVFCGRLTQPPGDKSEARRFERAVKRGAITAAAGGSPPAELKGYLSLDPKCLADVLKCAASHNQSHLVRYLLSEETVGQELLNSLLQIVASSRSLSMFDNVLEAGALDHGVALVASVKRSRNQDVTSRLLHTFRYDDNALVKAMIAAAGKGNIRALKELHSRISTAFLARSCEKSSESPGGKLTEEQNMLHEAFKAAAKNQHPEATRFFLQRMGDFESSKSVRGAMLSHTMFVWARQLDKGTTKDLCLSDPPPGNDSVGNGYGSPYILRLILGSGARLPAQHYFQLLEVMIIRGNETGARDFLENPECYTNTSVTGDSYLLALAIYRRRSNLIPSLMPFALDGSPLSTRHDGDSSTSNKNLEISVSTPLLQHQPTHKPCPTPLLAAVMTQDLGLCKALLDISPADVNAWCDYHPSKRPVSYYGSPVPPREQRFACLRNAFGGQPYHENPLLCAVKLGNVQLISLLLQHGADPWLAKPNISILELAIKQNVLRTLISWPHDESEYYVNRIEQHTFRRLLHWAAEHSDQQQEEGEKDLVGELVALGADVNALDGKQMTPLHAAIAAASVTGVEHLCWAGADLSRAPGSITTLVEPYVVSSAVEYAVQLAQCVDVEEGDEEAKECPPEQQEGEEESKAARRRKAKSRMRAKRQQQLQREKKAKQEETMTKRLRIAEFLLRWQQAGLERLSADSIRMHYEKDVAGRDEGSSVEPGDHDDGKEVAGDVDAISQFGDDESLHLSADESAADSGSDADPSDEWEIIEENPEEL